MFRGLELEQPALPQRIKSRDSGSDHMSLSDMKRTPLFDAHQRLGGKLIEFGGWQMPVHYTSIMEEHLTVRKTAGLFDISHMGEIQVEGVGAARFLNAMLTNDIGKLQEGQGQYTLLCNERGGVIDDLYAYRLGSEDFLLIVNASRIQADATWLERHRPDFGKGFTLHNASDEMGAVALQGPRAIEFINDCFQGPASGGTPVAHPSELAKNQISKFGFEGEGVWISRTGYTGEDGFEIVSDNNLIEPIWNKLLKVGHPRGLKPAGLGARDTLRTEVCYPLYGHELDENTTPIEAGLGFFVALDKGEFMGGPIIAEHKAKGVSKKLVAFKMNDKSAPPRPHYPIWGAGQDSPRLGQVTSGTQSPSLGIGIGLGYVVPGSAVFETAIEIEIRGRRVPATVVRKPIYRKAH
jgi:aminomethyltransferase